MTEDFKELIRLKIINYNRIVDFLMAVLIIVIRGAEVIQNNVVTAYYCIVFLAFTILDEFFYKQSNKFIKKYPYRIIAVRTHVYTFIICIGLLFTKIPAIYLATLLCYYLFLMCQEMIFVDVFDTFSNRIRYISSGVFVSVFFFLIQYRSEIKGIWYFMFIVAMIVVVITVLLIYDILFNSVYYFDNKYTKLYFRNADEIEENKKLVKYRERVEKVNNEINYQRINLKKANDDLEKNNIESRSLIEVMKYFSSSFDVKENARVMLQNVVDIKETGAAALYIEENSFMNEKPYIKIITDSPVAEVLFERDLENIYQAVRRRGNTTPLVLCENYDYKYPYLTGGRDICNAVAFPAYEGDKVYGVMVITSSRFDFFEQGYSFYESSLMDFTSALISDRLYLKTEDMAKKDGLTKIYNRIFFNQFYPELLSEVKEAGDILTVAMMDIDHFKNVNDTYGHLAGDEVIKFVASVDNEFAKKHGGKAIRFGGEEFLLILRGKGVEETHKILKEMHEKIRTTPVVFEDLTININSSMGLASYPETVSDINEVLDKADLAMYYSKEHGRGRITIDGKYN